MISSYQHHLHLNCDACDNNGNADETSQGMDKSESSASFTTTPEPTAPPSLQCKYNMHTTTYEIGNMHDTDNYGITVLHCNDSFNLELVNEHFGKVVLNSLISISFNHIIIINTASIVTDRTQNILRSIKICKHNKRDNGNDSYLAGVGNNGRGKQDVVNVVLTIKQRKRQNVAAYGA